MGTVFSLINYFYYFNYKHDKSKNTNINNNINEKVDVIIKENINENNDENDWKYPDEFFCPICINTLNENNNKSIGSFWIKFNCNHYIHYKCLHEYLTSVSYKKQCPFCREPLIVKHKTIESNLEMFKFYCKMIIHKE